MNAYSEDLRKKIVQAVERGDAQDRSRQDLRRGHLLCKALCGDPPKGEVPRPEEAPRLQTETGRKRQDVVGSRPKGAPGRHAAPEARVLAAGAWGGGQRLHGQ